jgi:hypothetical protein
MIIHIANIYKYYLSFLTIMKWYRHIVAGVCLLRYRTLEAISRKQHLLCWHRLSGPVSKG